MYSFNVFKFALLFVSVFALMGCTYSYSDDSNYYDRPPSGDSENFTDRRSDAEKIEDSGY